MPRPRRGPTSLLQCGWDSSLIWLKTAPYSYFHGAASFLSCSDKWCVNSPNHSSDILTGEERIHKSRWRWRFRSADQPNCRFELVTSHLALNWLCGSTISSNAREKTIRTDGHFTNSPRLCLDGTLQLNILATVHFSVSFRVISSILLIQFICFIPEREVATLSPNKVERVVYPQVLCIVFKYNVEFEWHFVHCWIRARPTSLSWSFSSAFSFFTFMCNGSDLWEVFVGSDCPCKKCD